MKLNRRAFVAAAGVAMLAGCASQDDGGNGLGNYDTRTETDVIGTDTTTETEVPRTTPSETQRPTSTSAGVPEEAGDTYATPPSTGPRLPLPMNRADLQGKAVSGGPPKDGIPSIENPIFKNAGEASLLNPGDPVFGLERNGVGKAYPQKVLVKHEICNDTVGGDPVAVTYCPLTGTAMGFERGETTFGVSGRLINNNLVMYDREHDVWWPQVLATSIPGAWDGSPSAASLREFRLIWTTWKRWRDRYPDTQVLTGSTDRVRDYGRDPYGSYNPTGGYYEEESTLFPRLNPNDRFHPKRMVLGARTSEGAAAFPRPALRERGTITGSLGDEPVVAVLDPRFGTGYVYRNPGESEVTLTDGQAQLGGSGYDPDALPLDRVYAFDAMWFAWSGFYPDSTVHE